MGPTILLVGGMLLIKVIAGVVFGVLLGIVTGLVPGLHLNTFIPFLLVFNGDWFVGFVVGVVISHSIFDFFPAMFLGVPEESTALSVLPAHKLALRGRALEAFQLTLFGGLFSSLIALALICFLIPLRKLDLRFGILTILVVTVFFMVLSAKRKSYTILIFLLAGFLGVKTLHQPNSLLALFSGFFGASVIINSLVQNSKLPRQKLNDARLPELKPTFFGAIAGIFSGLAPGISSSISSLVVKRLGRVREKDFLVVLGGANTVYAFTAIAAIFLIGKPRSGAGLLVSGIASPLLLAGCFLLALGLSTLLAWKLSPRVVTIFNKVPIQLLNVATLVFLCALTIIFRVFPLFVVSTSLGLVCISLGVRRNTCMASLLLPAILYYLP